MPGHVGSSTLRKTLEPGRTGVDTIVPLPSPQTRGYRADAHRALLGRHAVISQVGPGRGRPRRSLLSRLVGALLHAAG